MEEEEEKNLKIKQFFVCKNRLKSPLSLFPP